MSIYAVISSGVVEVPRRGGSGGTARAFPVISCGSSFSTRHAAVDALVARLEEIVEHADGEVVFYTYGRSDQSESFSGHSFGGDRPGDGMSGIRDLLEFRHDHVEVEAGGSRSHYTIVCIEEGRQ